MKAQYLGLQRRDGGLRACIVYWGGAGLDRYLTESYREFWL